MSGMTAALRALKDEAPRLLDKRDSGKLRLYPIIIKPCYWKGVEWLNRLIVSPLSSIKYESGVQWIDELLAEDEEGEYAE